MTTKQTKSQCFRDTATEEKWRELVADHENLSADGFKGKYGFTFGSVMNDAVARGYYEKKRNYSPTTSIVPIALSDSKPEFSVRNFKKGMKRINRTVQINEDINERLKVMYEEYGQYTNTVIFNQLLDDALELYGY